MAILNSLMLFVSGRVTVQEKIKREIEQTELALLDAQKNKEDWAGQVQVLEARLLRLKKNQLSA